MPSTARHPPPHGIPRSARNDTCLAGRRGHRAARGSPWRRRSRPRLPRQAADARRPSHHEREAPRRAQPRPRNLNEVNRMKKLILTLLVLAVAAPLSAQRLNPDLPGLGDKASEVVDVTLDGSMLRLAAKFLSDGDPDERRARDIVQKLEGIYVRSYEFDKEGEYARAVVERVRAQLGPSWKKIVDVRSRNRENSEIYIDTRGDQPVGMLIISAAPREPTGVGGVRTIDID